MTNEREKRRFGSSGIPFVKEKIPRIHNSLLIGNLGIYEVFSLKE